MVTYRYKDLKNAVGWWVLGVAIGGLSSHVSGPQAGTLSLLLAASLGGALGVLAAAAVVCWGPAGTEASAFLAQEELIDEIADDLAVLREDVLASRLQEEASTPHLPGFDRIQ
jgi:hypothetical protein